MCVRIGRQDPEQATVCNNELSSYRWFSVGRHAQHDSVVSEEVTIALGRLHPKRRDVIERFYFRGETCETIAADLGIPSSSVRTLLVRARAKLAPMLERFARSNYGLCSAGVDMHTEPPERKQADPDRIDAVVRDKHRRTFLRAQMTPDQLTAR